jgi:hypothetical protein
MSNLILNELIEPSWKKPIILLADQVGLLRSRVMRHLFGVNLHRLTSQLIKKILNNPSSSSYSFEAFNELLDKKWHVKDIKSYQSIIKNTLDNLKLGFKS